ncbi:MAG: Conjugative transposon protein TraO, partial [Bacteroidota bacterium]
NDTSAYKPLNLSKNKKHRLYENYEVQGGITKLGQQFKVGYSTNWENHYYSKYSVFYEMGNYKNIKISNIGLDWGIYGNIFKIPKYVYLNLFGGATVNYMTIASEGYSNDFSRSINYGFIGGAELELYLKKNLILLGHANQKFLFNAKQGNWMYYYGVGIKYTYLH